MMRDWSYRYEDMPSTTDEEFVAMIEMATREGCVSSVWMPRLVQIAKRGVAPAPYHWVWPWQVRQEPTVTAA